jgi:hypothetical protein
MLAWIWLILFRWDDDLPAGNLLTITGGQSLEAGPFGHLLQKTRVQRPTLANNYYRRPESSGRPLRTLITEDQSPGTGPMEHLQYYKSLEGQRPATGGIYWQQVMRLPPPTPSFSLSKVTRPPPPRAQWRFVAGHMLQSTLIPSSLHKKRYSGYAVLFFLKTNIISCSTMCRRITW